MGRREGELTLGPLAEVLGVLTLFLVTTVSFAPQSQLQVRGPGINCEDPHPPRSPVVVLLRADQLRVTDEGAERWRIDHQRDEHGRLRVAALTTGLAALKAAHPELDAIHISAEDDVPYDDLIRVVDTVKPAFSIVVISPAPGG